VIAPARKPELHVRVSVTDRCQLRCLYCMPAAGVRLGRRDDILHYEEIAALVSALQQEFDVRKVRITGGEPLVRRNLASLVRMLAALGVPDLAMTTNGVRLADLAAELRDAGLQRINVSLDSLQPEVFRRLTRGGDVNRTVAGIDAALRCGLTPVKINTVIAENLNDAEASALLSFALKRGCELRFLEVMPVGCGIDLHASGFIPAAEVRRRIGADFDLAPLPVQPASSSRRYGAVRRADGLRGVVGFIAPCSEPFCDGCTRLRLTSDGRMIGCLAREDGLDVRNFLRDGDTEAICRSARQVLGGKRADSRFEQPTVMAAIGG
jgi:GTP 3',8-cyclase